VSRAARSSRTRSFSWLAFGLVLAASAAGCDAFRGPRSCRLGDEHVVQLTRAKEIDAIAVVALAASTFAFWSEPDGAFGRALDGEGKPVGAVVRLGSRCAGGLAAAADTARGSLVLACSAHAEAGSAGAVRVLRLDRGLRVHGAHELAAIGAQSEGLGVVIVGGRLHVVWHDGSAEVQRVWWATLDADDRVVDAPRALSDPARIASAPSLAAQRGGSVATWSERFMEGEALRTTVVRWDAKAGLRTLLAQANVSAMPQLVSLDQRLVLAVRDRPRDAKIGLYVSFVDEQRLGVDALVRVGRADGVGRPALEPCMGGLVSATPRTYGGDYFIGFNWLDAALRRTRGEQQFYEDSHAFTQVAAACLGPHAVLLIAEFPQLLRETAALRALPYRCE
jgi:hypothetical protein